MRKRTEEQGWGAELPLHPTPPGPCLPGLLAALLCSDVPSGFQEGVPSDVFIRALPGEKDAR